MRSKRSTRAALKTSVGESVGENVARAEACAQLSFGALSTR